MKAPQTPKQRFAERAGLPLWHIPVLGSAADMLPSAIRSAMQTKLGHALIHSLSTTSSAELPNAVQTCSDHA